MLSVSLTSLANHLWQSTIFAAAAGLGTLILRNNPARVRHWVWVTASIKFLVPFSLLIYLGSQIQWRAASAIERSSVPAVVEQMSEPFTIPDFSSMPVPKARNPFPGVLFALWASGCLAISVSWLMRWRRVRSAVRSASRVELGLPITTLYSKAFQEPGVYGVFRPVLLLPAGILEQLTAEQLRSVVAHELCHVRHRDNLIAVFQMFVETVFWFHPLVWWIGKRIFEERERACDEEVLKLGNEPGVYARGILKVCELYLESPVPCVAGISSANLRGRIEAIAA